LSRRAIPVKLVYTASSNGQLNLLETNRFMIYETKNEARERNIGINSSVPK